MTKEPVLFFVGSRCDPGLEKKFSDWYENVHVPMAMKSGHVQRAWRYRLNPVAKTGSPSQFLAVYQFKDQQAFEEWFSSPEVDEARKEKEQSWPKGMEINLRGLYELTKKWER